MRARFTSPRSAIRYSKPTTKIAPVPVPDKPHPSKIHAPVAFTPSATLPQQHRWKTAKGHAAALRFHINFFHATGDHIWQLCNRLVRRSGRLEVVEALRSSGVDALSYMAWKKVIQTSDLTQALQILWTMNGLNPQERLRIDLQPIRPITAKELLSLGPDPASVTSLPSLGELLKTRLPPSWVTLHLLSSRVMTLSCAEYAAPFALSQLSSMPGHLVPPMIALTIQSLSRWSLTTPVGNLLHAFVHHEPMINRRLYYNALITALAHFDDTTRDIIPEYLIPVIQTMRARQIKLFSSSYDSLLNSDTLTFRLVTLLRMRMSEESRTPKASHLEALLRYDASTGSVTEALRRKALLREMIDGTNTHSSEERKNLRKREHTNQVIRAMNHSHDHDARSMFEYVSDLNVMPVEEAAPLTS